jgi:enterochelin esterase-like enzyme
LSVSCDENAGSVTQATFQSNLMGKDFQLQVYLPACFSSESGVRYPVLYLLHGQTYTEDQWIRLGAKDFADKLIQNREREPFLMVMPFDEENLLPTTDSKFGQVIVEELIPWIDEHYPTCSEKSCRAIAGLSRGAGWAIRIGLSHPELFESAAAHSLPSFNGDDKQIPIWLKGIEINDLPRIWMDSGRSDIFLPQAKEFEAALTKNQVPHEFYVFAGYHNEEYWQLHMEDYISWSTLSWK